MPSQTQDRDFEFLFADLAFASLKDRAPSLIDNLVGFQVLDVNDDKTKATGVFGCLVGDEWIYLPVWFMNSQLKGDELAYLKNQDQFVPCKDNWIQFLTSKPSTQLGEASTTARGKLMQSSMDLRSLRESPITGKYASAHFYRPYAGVDFPCWGASDIQDWAAPAVRPMAQAPAGGRFDKAAAAIDLCKFLSGAGPWTALAFAKMAAASPKLQQALDQFYDVGQLLEGIRFQPVGHGIVKAAHFGKAYDIPVTRFADGSAMTAVKSAAKADLGVRVLTYKDLKPFEQIPGLTDEDRKRLMNGEAVVRDNRTQVAKVYRAAFSGSITSPNRTGVYQVLLENGETTKAFVGLAPKDTDNYCSLRCNCNPQQAEQVAVVVNMDGKGVTHAPAKRINAITSPKNVLNPLDDPAFEPVRQMKVGNRYVAVTKLGDCTRPFLVRKRQELADGQLIFYISDSVYSMPEEITDGDLDKCKHLVKLVITPGESKIQRSKKLLTVPENASCLEIKVDVVKYDYGSRVNADMPELGGEDVIEQLIVGSSMAPLKLFTNQSGEYHLTVGNLKSAGSMNRIQTVRSLVLQHGMSEVDASSIIKEADARRQCKVLVDYPAGYPVMDDRQIKRSETLTPYEVGAVFPPPQLTANRGGYPETQTDTQANPVQGLATDPGAGRINNDDLVNNTVQQAAQASMATGQKDILDAAVMSGLIRANDSAGLVDKHLGDLILALDRIGRIYFLFLTHNDKFAERYGQEDMLELEDNLRNVFMSLGDLTLFLKTKNVDQEDPSETLLN
jgi:hypothetical protein